MHRQRPVRIKYWSWTCCRLGSAACYLHLPRFFTQRSNTHLVGISPDGLTDNDLLWRQIARRVQSAEHVSEHNMTARGKARAVRYMPHALDEQVFLHPSSYIAKAAPELVAYMQIVRTEKRSYMTGAEQGTLMARAS